MRRATIRTELAHARVAANAVSPDNTPQMTTTVEDGADGGRGTVVTTIERETTGGLQSTVDDYVVNLSVAETVAARGIDYERQTEIHNHE